MSIGTALGIEEFDKLDAVTQADLTEFYESRVRHRDFAIEGCSCSKCDVHHQREHGDEQRRLFRKALRGIRRA